MFNVKYNLDVNNLKDDLDYDLLEERFEGLNELYKLALLFEFRNEDNKVFLCETLKYYLKDSKFLNNILGFPYLYSNVN